MRESRTASRTSTGLLVAIGSTRQPKVRAVEEAFARIHELTGIHAASFQSRSAESGISKTPLSIEEMQHGARNRAAHLRELYEYAEEAPAFYIGLEGGLFRAAGDKVLFLQSWVYATDGQTGHFGGSPAISLPANVSRRFGAADIELADVMDALVDQQDTRDKGGAFAILTGGLLNRQKIFEQAVLAAMAPFYLPGIYGRSAG